MRKKNPEIMERILSFTDEFQREYRRSPSTTEIANEVGVGRGTAYTYLIAMRDRNMIEYDGKNITTPNTSRINHRNHSIPVVGRVVCGDPNEEEQNIREYVDLPASLFGYNGNLFILEAYGDSMNQAGIDEGDYIVVKEQQTANDGDLVVALTNNENNLKRIHFDDKKKVIVLCPESSNPIHKPKEYKDVRIQGVVLYIIKKAI